MASEQNSLSAEPAVTVVHTVEEADQLPEGALVIWIDGVSKERQAAVVRMYDGQRSMEHTKSGSYWVDGIHMIEYPAQAFTWPASEGNEPLTNNDEAAMLKEVRIAIDWALSKGHGLQLNARQLEAAASAVANRLRLSTRTVREADESGDRDEVHIVGRLRSQIWT